MISLGNKSIFYLFFSTLLTNVICDTEGKFPTPTSTVSVSEVENVFPVDSLDLMQNVNRDVDSDDDSKPSFQNNKLVDVDKDEVVFSVLESSKTKDEEQAYALDGALITDADLPNPTQVENKTIPVKNKTSTVECALRETSDEVPAVILANSSLLFKVLAPNTTNSTLGECNVVLFFSSQCVFSARMAPHYNALARVFPRISFYALDTVQHYNVHIRYGIVAVPNVLLFHNGKAVSRFNETVINLDNLVHFITKYTSLPHNDTLNVTSADMNGPVPASLTKRVDLVLILAWAFTIFCICLWFLKSPLCHKIVESVKNTWREAEAQHEHAE